MTFSDENTSISVLRGRILDFARERDWIKFHRPKNLAMSIGIEAAELMELFQWKDQNIEEFKTDEKAMERVSEEIADVIIYSLEMANTLGLDVTKSVLDKIEKNGKKYPVDRIKGTAKKYT